MITPFTSNDKLKDKQLQQNAERNRDTGEKSKETSLINRKITNQLAGLSIDGKMVGFAMPVSCQHPYRKECIVNAVLCGADFAGTWCQRCVVACSADSCNCCVFYASCCARCACSSILIISLCCIAWQIISMKISDSAVIKWLNCIHVGIIHLR